MPVPIERLSFEANRLMRDHPPVIEHPNKQAIYDIACPAVCVHDGEVGYSRWRAMTLPTHVEARLAPEMVEARSGVFDYAPVPDLPGAVEWHVNFADPLLFLGYGSELFAQDEVMLAEHPVLGALVEALHAGAHRAVTEEAGRPTPVLVTGVARRVRVATDVNKWEHRPKGLYGTAFASAHVRTVRESTHRLSPPTVSNIIAIAAPQGGSGAYDRATVERILTTAYTGFAAAVAESATLVGEDVPVVIHTGYWGCGAFGGNRQLMSMVQILAARMAGAARLVFHTVTFEGAAPLDDALKTMREIYTDRPAIATSEAIRRIVVLGLQWGQSDGS